MWAIFLDLNVEYLVLLFVTSLRKALFYCLPFSALANDKQKIIGSSKVKIEKVSDRYGFIIIFVGLNNEINIFWYCILEYDDNIIFDMNVSYMSFLTISKQSSLIISLTIFESFK